MVYNIIMQVSLSDAKARLTDLVRRAEAGEHVVLTRHGRPTVRLVAEKRDVDPEAREAIIRRIQGEARKKVIPGPDAARSQDFLYDENGLPA